MTDVLALRFGYFTGATEREWVVDFGVTSLMLELLPDGRIIWNIFTVHQQDSDWPKMFFEMFIKNSGNNFQATNSLLIHCAFGQISLDFWRIVAWKYVLLSKNASIKLRQIVGHLCSREEKSNLWILLKYTNWKWNWIRIFIFHSLNSCPTLVLEKKRIGVGYISILGTFQPNWQTLVYIFPVTFPIASINLTLFALKLVDQLCKPHCWPNCCRATPRGVCQLYHNLSLPQFGSRNHDLCKWNFGILVNH